MSNHAFFFNSIVTAHTTVVAAQAAKLEGQKTETDNLKQEMSQQQRDNEGIVRVLWSETQDRTIVCKVYVLSYIFIPFFSKDSKAKD